MTYKEFLQITNHSGIYTMLLHSNGERLEFQVNSEEDLINVEKLNWDKVSFKHFKK